MSLEEILFGFVLEEIESSGSLEKSAIHSLNSIYSAKSYNILFFTRSYFGFIALNPHPAYVNQVIPYVFVQENDKIITGNKLDPSIIRTAPVTESYFVRYEVAVFNEDNSRVYDTDASYENIEETQRIHYRAKHINIKYVPAMFPQVVPHATQSYNRNSQEKAYYNPHPRKLDKIKLDYSKLFTQLCIEEMYSRDLGIALKSQFLSHPYANDNDQFKPNPHLRISFAPSEIVISEELSNLLYDGSVNLPNNPKPVILKITVPERFVENNGIYVDYSSIIKLTSNTTSQVPVEPSEIGLYYIDNSSLNSVVSEIIAPKIYANNRSGLDPLNLDKLVNKAFQVPDKHGEITSYADDSTQKQIYFNLHATTQLALKRTEPSIDPTYKVDFVPKTPDSIILPDFSNIQTQETSADEKHIDEDAVVRVKTLYPTQKPSLDGIAYAERQLAPAFESKAIKYLESNLDQILEIRNEKEVSRNTAKYDDLSNLIKDIEYVDGLIVENGSVLVNETINNEDYENLKAEVLSEENEISEQTFAGRSRIAVAYRLLEKNGYKPIIRIKSTEDWDTGNRLVDYILEIAGMNYETQGITYREKNREPPFKKDGHTPMLEEIEEGSNIKVIIGDFKRGHRIRLQKQNNRKFYEPPHNKRDQHEAVVKSEEFVVPDSYGGYSLSSVINEIGARYNFSDVNPGLRYKAKKLMENPQFFAAVNGKSFFENLNEVMLSGGERVQAGFRGNYKPT